MDARKTNTDNTAKCFRDASLHDGKTTEFAKNPAIIDKPESNVEVQNRVTCSNDIDTYQLTGARTVGDQISSLRKPIVMVVSY
jgi:hypothetical protein